MMSSDPDRERAEGIIARLVAQTSEENMVRRIDASLDRAAELFAYPPDQAHTPEHFHRTLAAFVRCLYAHAPLFGRNLTEDQAHDEAMALLTQAYRGDFASGYEGAVTDAAYAPGSGIKIVLERLQALIKARLRHAYRRWLFQRLVDPADWHTRSQLAVVLFEKCRPYMPPELSQCSPDQFTDDTLLQFLDLYTALQ